MESKDNKENNGSIANQPEAVSDDVSSTGSGNTEFPVPVGKQTQRKPQDASKPNRAWVFTLNNPADGDDSELLSYEGFSYITFGREIAPETGTPHLQGYIVAPNAIRWSTLHTKFPRVWWAPASKFSSHKQRIAYCQKGGIFEERGIEMYLKYDLEYEELEVPPQVDKWIVRLRERNVHK